MSTEEEIKQVQVEEQKPIDVGMADAPIEEKAVEDKPAEEVKEEEQDVKKETKEEDEQPTAEAEAEKKPAITSKSTGRKFDPSALPESSDPEEIRKQVEFYFSDSNLRFDKFLFGLVGKENKWVPIKMVASFKRMQRFKDPSAIQAALETSEVLELSSNKTMIRRKVPLDLNVDSDKIKEIQDRAQSRSLYAKGFGVETPTTQIDIEKHFEPYGPINAVRLRRDDKKVFKGSVFVEFKNDETMEKFIALDEKPKYKDEELVYMRKKDYVEMKIQDIKDGKVQPQDRKVYENKMKHKFDALRLGDARPRGTRSHDKKDGEGNEKRESGHGGRGGRGRGRGRGGRGGRAARGGRKGGDRNGDKNGSVGDEHSIPKVQASGEQRVKRQLEDAGENAGNDVKKIKTGTEATA